MWPFIASFILRQRIAILLFLAAITAFMGYQSQFVRMSYRFGGLLPKNDSTQLAYTRFTEQFSDDGAVIGIGVDDPRLYEHAVFSSWHKLGNDIRRVSVPKDTLIDGENSRIQKSAVDSIFSVASCYNIVKDTSEHKFTFKKVLSGAPRNQEQTDSVKQIIRNLPFYRGLLYDEDSDASLMMVFVNSPLFNSEDRGKSVEQIVALVNRFSQESGVRTYISGLPFIRTEIMNKVKAELNLFILLAAGVTALLLFLFFRNVSVVVVSLLVVGIGVVISMGTISLLDYPISMLMGLIPPLIIVIGVPNCVYLINKYHGEYKKHGNKFRALARVILKVGNATFMTNATTAVGFATFIFTDSDLLIHFGVVASLNVMGVFIISLIVVPTIYSFLPAPRSGHTKHLDRKWVFYTVNKLVYVLTHHRRTIYILTASIVVFGILGILRIKTTGNIVDDLPKEDRVISDLKFFESRFKGVMPFEILIDSGKKGNATKPAMLEKVNEFQILLEGYPEISRSLSVVDASKFAKQAFYNGSPDRYDLIKRNEQTFIGPYLQGDYETHGIETMFMDTSKSITRVSAQIADIGTLQMQSLLQDLRQKTDSIFDPKKFEVTYTGTSVVFLEGTNYLVNNLLVSLVIAIVVIAFLMAILFRSARMVFISLLPNMIPLIFTAGIMGYLGIPIKPSTLLVFSVALGISVDDTIHFLAKYRQELKLLQWNIRDSVLLAVRETGISMMYTSIILFFGFGIFSLSQFDGTQALGILISMTLLVAMITNLLLLPSLLLSFNQWLTTKAFSEPLLEIIDEEDELDLEELQIRPGLYNRENE